MSLTAPVKRFLVPRQLWSCVMTGKAAGEPRGRRSSGALGGCGGPSKVIS